MKRRTFLQHAVAAPAYAGLAACALNEEGRGASGLPTGRYTPGRIVNEYNLLLLGEREELKNLGRLHPELGRGRSIEVVGGDVYAQGQYHRRDGNRR